MLAVVAKALASEASLYGRPRLPEFLTVVVGADVLLVVADDVDDVVEVFEAVEVVEVVEAVEVVLAEPAADEYT